MVDNISSMPFDVQSQIQAIERDRRRIEIDLAISNTQKDHYRTHRAEEALQEARLDILHSYDKMGKRIEFEKKQGSLIDIQI